MKNIHHHFVHHLRSYRTFHFMFFTFFLLLTSIGIHIFGNTIYADDLLEQAFKPAMTNETIINLGAGKNAVGNEVLRQGVVIQEDGGLGCFVQGNKIDGQELKKMVCENQYQGIWDSKVGGDDCTLPNGSLTTISNNQKQPFCEDILGGDWKAAPIVYEAPLIVRITKFLLRITMVLAVTMVIFNGIMWIIESAKGAEVKNAKQNIILIVVGIFIALMSLGIINLISSLTMSSLDSTTGSKQGCLFNNAILSSNEVNNKAEEHICLSLGGYKRDSERTSGNKCYKEDTSKSECDKLGGSRGGALGENSNNCYIKVDSAEQFSCEVVLGYKRDSERTSGNKCYKEDTSKSECDKLGGSRGGALGENSNNCYIKVADTYLCNIFGGIYQN